jgi:probable rRNA maturation factor
MSTAVANRQNRVAVSPARLARTAERALAALGRAAGDVDVLVVDDPAIKRLNRIHRGVDRRTDVLAFPLETPGTPSPLVGQIVISAETARRQARHVDVALATELDLLVTHGVLHLVGYDDRDPIEARLMHEREREILWAARRRLPARLWRGLLETPQLSEDQRKPERRRAGRAMEPAAVNQSRIPRRGRSGVRSIAAPVSGHPRSKPASRTPLP